MRGGATSHTVGGAPPSAIAILDACIGRLAPGGEVVIAGFYTEPLSFGFVPAFRRGARLRVAAEWRPADLAGFRALAVSGRVPLDDLVTHSAHPDAAAQAYATAFDDPDCIKMVIDWRTPA